MNQAERMAKLTAESLSAGTAVIYQDILNHIKSAAKTGHKEHKFQRNQYDYAYTAVSNAIRKLEEEGFRIRHVGNTIYINW